MHVSAMHTHSDQYEKTKIVNNRRWATGKKVPVDAFNSNRQINDKAIKKMAST